MNRILLILLLASVGSSISARNPSDRPSQAPTRPSYRAVCTNSLSSIDQEINNVRARLLGGGDCWWDLRDGRYVVPKVDPSTGQREVSSIFAGSVWLGGVDPGKNLKLACQDYRNDGRNDFWPGPLEAEDPVLLGTTNRDICKNWDRHFRVLGSEIREHLRRFRDGNYDASSIPDGLRSWPAKGNPYFTDAVGWSLPFTQAGLAGFFDFDGDGLYDPLKGDYPSIEIRGCDLSNFPDEMIFWIYNDQGGGAPHARTGGSPIQMEVQVQAFGYQTSDALNDMTFQRYKLINRAPELIDSTFFAFWCDIDLGCSEDDYIGVDSVRSFAYVYNQDGTDGQPGASCAGGVATYANFIPAIGIDYFRGPLDENGDSIGMSSFMYMNRAGVGNPPAATTDASQPNEYYNYLTGYWKDNTPVTPFSSGYNPTSTAGTVRYCFPSIPTDPNGWSMCTANLPIGDRRTLQATGPFRLLPTAVNELIVGLPWVAGIGGNCPDLTRLFRADDLAQGLFDNCFRILNGPPNPPLEFVELDKEIVMVMQNYKISEQDYNNDKLLQEFEFRGVPPTVPREKRQFKFQGYRIYQVLSPNVSPDQYNDVKFAREIATIDLRDSVQTIYNWDVIKNPTDTGEYYLPRQMVVGQNKGLKHTFSFKEDAFALGNDKQLINHKEYYYSIVAYAFNEWAKFEPFPNGQGQRFPYLPGRLDVKIYTAIPRSSIDGVLQSEFGQGIPVTRYEGEGAGGNFLELSADTKAKMPDGDHKGVIGYEAGKGPITVTVFNPYEVKKGNFELVFVDSTQGNAVLNPDTRWKLIDLDTKETIFSESDIFSLNEQIIAKYGISITVAQSEEVGQNQSLSNGAIGVEIEYADATKAWLTGVPDQANLPFDYIQNEDFAADQPLDPNQSLSTMGDGWMVPFYLCNWRHAATTRLITPMWMPQSGALVTSALGDLNARKNAIAKLPNVDIVLTPDKSKWSRCVVVETANFYYTSTTYPRDQTLRPQGPDEALDDPSKWRRMFDTRWADSVDKDGKPDGSGTKGFGWFPGYAIDVETGRRLNVFFGENSCYKSDLNPKYTGRDMLFNPTDLFFNDRTPLDPGDNEYYDIVMGGHHYIYVTDETYDGCAELAKSFDPALYSGPNPAASAKRSGVRRIQWAGMPYLFPTSSLRSVADGLVPTETRIKCRVQNPYQVRTNPDNDENKGYPRYRFSIDGQERRELAGVEIDNALDQIRVVPNPYYSFSQYENNPTNSVVKITNLPPVCTVTIYSFDGKFIRTFNRNEQYSAYNQITDALDWDMKNSKGIPIASGVYIIHVKSPQGERTLKWFGISRRFDPSNL